MTWATLKSWPVPTAFLAAACALLVLCSTTPRAQETSGGDPERIAAAKELMEVTGTNKQLDSMISVMGQSFRKGVGDAAGSSAADSAGKQFDRFMSRMMSYRQAMLDEFAVIYAQRFTLDELKSVTAFYSSPTGKKFIEAMPELMQVGGQVGVKYAQKAMQDLRKGGTP